MSSAIIRLCCPVKEASYGKKGSSSVAARFGAATAENRFFIDEEKRYGEMWMGDHPNGAATLASDPKTGLRDRIEANPEEYLTAGIFERFSKAGHLPYLFKVLSFDKALPLQAHPGRKLARQLKRDEQREDKEGKNEEFVDDNPKPEVAVAISDHFEGFVGFRPVREIKAFLKTVPELRLLLSNHETVEEFLAGPDSDDADDQRLRLKKMFSELIEQTTHIEIVACAQQLLTHVERGGDDVLGDIGTKGLAGLIKKIIADYPDDVALFAAVFFLNHVVLNKGEGITVPAEYIHAYLEGDVIECMVWSDNMIAHGFQPQNERQSPKLFVDTLDYHSSPSKNLELKRTVWNKCKERKAQLYHCPMAEFDLVSISLGARDQDCVPDGINGPAIFVVTKGAVELSSSSNDQKEMLREGQVVFVKPATTLNFVNHEEDAAEIWGVFIEA